MKKILFIVVICFVSTFSYSQSKKNWEKTQSLNSIAAYKDFIVKYPDGKYLIEAKQKLAQLEHEIAQQEFAKAKQINTIKAYQAFIQKTSDSQLITEAKIQISRIQQEQAEYENKRFSESLTIGTDDALIAFIQDFKKSSLVDSAINRLKGYEMIKPEEVIPWSSLPKVYAGSVETSQVYPCGIDFRAFDVQPEESYEESSYLAGPKSYYLANKGKLTFHNWTRFDGYFAKGIAIVTLNGLVFDKQSRVYKKHQKE